MFDADLKCRDRGNEQIAGAGGNDAAYVVGQFRRRGREPEQGTGVEQQGYAFGQSSAASGATGSS